MYTYIYILNYTNYIYIAKSCFMRRIVSGHMTRHSMHDKESHDITLGSSSPVHRFWAERGQRPSNLPP